jgi:hypothetical protein
LDRYPSSCARPPSPAQRDGRQGGAGMLTQRMHHDARPQRSMEALHGRCGAQEAMSSCWGAHDLWHRGEKIN